MPDCTQLAENILKKAGRPVVCLLGLHIQLRAIVQGVEIPIFLLSGINIATDVAGQEMELGIEQESPPQGPS